MMQKEILLLFENSCSELIEHSLLKEPKNVNPIGIKVAQLGLMTGRCFAFFVVMSL
jgi:hypothetical protein